MKPTHIEHIGIAVKDLEAAIKFFESIFNIKCSSIEEVKEQSVRTAIFPIGETKIELLETTDPQGPVGKFIKKNGEGIHHIAFSVNNIESRLEELSKKGIRLIDKKPRKGAEGLNIAFLHPKDCFGTLIELCENKS
ncbi:MAG: methylmalonyl-CoA epimerase [Bacteroidia bacterium]|nr:methylmalonyl-CoA epimerase [Bacteroidia bacterium]